MVVVCGNVLCGSDELYAALDDFRRSVELLAGLVYSAAKLAGNSDVAVMVEKAVRRYVEDGQEVKILYSSCAHDCRYEDDAEECHRGCEESYRALVEERVNSIIARG